MLRVGILSICVIAMVLVAVDIRAGEEVMEMKEIVPRELAGWNAKGEDGVYDRENIFEYMDGAGELYRSYGFKKLLVRKFAKSGQPEIVVEVFDMGSSEDAFGVFAHGGEGAEVGIGQESEYQSGLLCFWKGKFFVCVFTDKETKATKEAVLALGKAIASRIRTKGKKPQLVDYLPKGGLVERGVRYFHNHSCLNYHYFVSDRNILRLGDHTEAVLGEYKSGKSKFYLLVVRYPSLKQSKAGFDSFVKAYMPEWKEKEGKAVARMENGKWTGAALERELVLVVFDVPSRREAETILKNAKYKIGEVRR